MLNFNEAKKEIWNYLEEVQEQIKEIIKFYDYYIERDDYFIFFWNSAEAVDGVSESFLVANEPLLITRKEGYIMRTGVSEFSLEIFNRYYYKKPFDLKELKSSLIVAMETYENKKFDKSFKQYERKRFIYKKFPFLRFLFPQVKERGMFRVEA